MFRSPSPLSFSSPLSAEEAPIPFVHGTSVAHKTFPIKILPVTLIQNESDMPSALVLDWKYINALLSQA